MKRIFICLMMCLCLHNLCFAKVITDDSGSISFETSNQWHLASLGEDPLTYELISIMYDNNTFIKFTQSKYSMKYKNLSQATDREISELRDYMIRYYINEFKAKGYTFTINKTDCFQNSIIIGAILKKGNIIGKMITISYIKDYVGYLLVAVCTDTSSNETMKTLNTLKIDGVKINTWMQQ